MRKRIFEKLKDKYRNYEANILAENYPHFNNHKIGIDSSLQPLVLIYSNNLPTFKAAPRKLNLIEIAFNQLCVVGNLECGSKEARYTILKLKSDNPDLQDYFLKICTLILSILGDIPKVEKVQREVVKVIELFSNLSNPPKKTIQGLFAELIIINESTHSDLLVEAWHTNNYDLDDFNDGKCCLEVKSTIEKERIHSFSHNQLINKDHNSFVASTLIKYSGAGTSLMQLADRIELKLTEIKNKIKLNEIITSVIGKDFNLISDVLFDYEYSASSVKLYKTNKIYRIDDAAIPKEVTGVSYFVNLSQKEENSNIEKVGFLKFIRI